MESIIPEVKLALTFLMTISYFMAQVFLYAVTTFLPVSWKSSLAIFSPFSLYTIHTLKQTM
jgi:hypothetical protein